MLRQIILGFGLVLALPAVHAAEAGKVIFVAGSAQIADRAAAEGSTVQEGDMLSTGASGFMYVKTIDNGLLMLRPNTRARIATYHIDQRDPSKTRIKLELISGVARSRSGEAVKLARQNFRFNTPVAAIGVRGTDFTVFTDQDTSRVSVLSGGIVVSGFVDACRPDGGGPCEGISSRELSASQRGVLLQVQRGQVLPQLMQGNAAGPDQLSPPRIDEPVAKASVAAPAAPSLDAKKNDTLNQVKANTPVTVPSVPAEPLPPVVMPPPSVVDSGPPKPDSQIIWGRWLPLLNTVRKINFDVEKAQHELVAVSGYYALFRTAGNPYLAPNEGKAGFVMNASEAFVNSVSDTGVESVQAASLSNGKLNLDFAAKTFVTSVDLASPKDNLTLRANGSISSNGGLYGVSSKSERGLIDVEGLLSNEQGGSAAYIFTGRLDPKRTVNGVTYWRK